MLRGGLEVASCISLKWRPRLRSYGIFNRPKTLSANSFEWLLMWLIPRPVLGFFRNGAW